MSKSLKQKTIAGMIWSSFGKFGTLGLSFISNLVLARLLMPSDFGYIGMLHIFIAISQVFISGGLGSALIQKKDPTQIDFTTVFYWNLFLSLFFVVVLFFSAEYIAGFYAMPLLKDILRVQSIGLIINSFSLVQSTQLQKNLRFKQLSVRNVVASLVGVVVAVTMAFMGYGVWSLVFSSLVSRLASVFLLWKMSTWRPTLEFSFHSLKRLFNFGGIMLMSYLVETVYTNIQGLIIGKVFSAKLLGYYTQARKLEEVPTIALSSVVNQVSFPVFSQLQDNPELLKHGVRKNIKAISFINFPLMVLLITVARPLFLLLYTQKWEMSIPYFQILCVGAMLYTLNTVNTNVMKSIGKVKVYFWVQLSKRVMGILLIIFSIRYGIEAMLWAMVLFYYISYLINGIVTGKLIDYGILAQMKDVGATYMLSIVVGIVSFYAFTSLFTVSNYVLALFSQITVYLFLFLSLAYLLRIEGFFIYKEVIEHFIQQRRKKG